MIKELKNENHAYLFDGNMNILWVEATSKKGIRTLIKKTIKAHNITSLKFVDEINLDI